MLTARTVDMTDKSNNLSEQIKIHGKVIQKSMSDISETARQAIADINAGFDEAQRRIDEMQRLADFTESKSPKGMASQNLGIVHGKEYVFEKSLERHRCIAIPLGTITINIPKGG